MTDSVDDFFNKKKKKKEKKGKKVVTATDLLLKTEDTAEESTLNPDLKVNREHQVIHRNCIDLDFDFFQISNLMALRIPRFLFHYVIKYFRFKKTSGLSQ